MLGDVFKATNDEWLILQLKCQYSFFYNDIGALDVHDVLLARHCLLTLGVGPAAPAYTMLTALTAVCSTS